ncbi:cobyrinate a,c-diamide synthase [Maridesulfovibrio salexigens]|uniref:Cobyrinate a,c-diamide synthase n=1 Tax=Maridesulfovibrio salexigens (strain ATCC 14822 / DSM 2638 / NCIMB 8403 / VKM B-1763) TaxID=526222 RepID=C6BZ32_MARSD|nr:cobyrinate a,c-diamide synthase [Maridesulfovibrio salexigens]ACS78856.1 cobyrinic acid a,c-diamide synthase [Maridesulfovibrio salexigens DSM 2638]
MNFPRIVLAGLSGGTGKTIVTLGLCRAFRNQGRAVKPFKKGPDYIDARWLGLASGQYATNLDPFLMPNDKLISLFLEKGQGADISIVEGNRGLFDGKDVDGSCSTAELARIIKAPVLLTIDCTKMTRTVAAIVAGCKAFEDGFNLAGVILNRTAGERHRNILKNSIEAYTDIPVLGMLPKLKENPIPERHMGLVSNTEYGAVDKALDTLGQMAEDCLDLEAIRKIAENSSSELKTEESAWSGIELSSESKPVIGVVRDEALWFYYEENLEALRRAGAEVKEVSIFSSEPWPEIHGLYLGGGFPETLAPEISRNSVIREYVRSLAESGLPIFAECGGFMYLGRDVEYEGQKYAMSGVLDLSTRLCPRPQGLGYTSGKIVHDNPFLPVGTEVIGHEFHYSLCVDNNETAPKYALDMSRGKGMADGHDGLIRDNIYAGYNHIHALSMPCWANNFVKAAEKFKNK